MFDNFMNQQQQQQLTQAQAFYQEYCTYDSSTTDNMTNCDHTEFVSHRSLQLNGGEMQKLNCKQCGCYVSESGHKTLKEAHLNFKVDVSPIELYEQLLEDEQLFSYYQFYKQHQAGVNDGFAFHHELQELRKPLVERIFEFGEKLHQSKLTVHIAIAYSDYLLFKQLFNEFQERQIENPHRSPTQSEKVRKQKFDIKAQMCLLLASKYDELDDKIPLIREIQKLARFEFAYRDCKNEEELILKALNWKLMVITPLQIIQSLLGMGVVFDNDNVKIDGDDVQKSIDQHNLRKVRRFTEHFADLAMKGDWDFQTFQPSVLALSCILCARMASSIVPLWSNKLAEMTIFEFESNKEIQDCFEKLYQLYDENFKPSKNVYLSKLKPQKSMISTCEPTPNNNENNQDSNQRCFNKKSNILEDNQNIMNESFINIQKSITKEDKQQHPRQNTEYDDEVDAINDSISTAKGIDLIPSMAYGNNRQQRNNLPIGSISCSNRSSVSNINLNRVQPLHKLMTNVPEQKSVSNKRMSGQIKYNKENQSSVTSTQYLQNQLLPKSCRLSTNPITKKDTQFHPHVESTKNINNSALFTIPVTRCTSNISHQQPQSQSKYASNSLAQYQKQLSNFLKNRNQSLNNLNFTQNSNQILKNQQNFLSSQKMTFKLSNITQKQQLSQLNNDSNHYSKQQSAMTSRIQAIKSLNNSQSRKPSVCSNNSNNTLNLGGQPKMNQTVTQLVNQKLKLLQDEGKLKSNPRNQLFGCHTSRNSIQGIGNTLQSLDNNSQRTHNETQQIHDLHYKYQTLSTKLEKFKSLATGRNQQTTLLDGFQTSHNRSIASFNDTAQRQATTEKEYTTENNRNLGLVLHPEISQSFSLKPSMKKENPSQFQTIQEDLKRKHTIMEEESEGERSMIEFTDTSQIQGNTDEFQILDEESVVIKKPISSKKSKSLENIAKKLGKKSQVDQTIIEMYKQQYQQQQQQDINNHTRNPSALANKATKITTLDLPLQKNSTQLNLLTAKSIAGSQKVNFIKKNINYISELNTQLQQSLDIQTQDLTIKVEPTHLEKNCPVSSQDNSRIITKRGSRSSNSMSLQNQLQKENDSSSVQRRFSKFNRISDYSILPKSNQQSKKALFKDKSHDNLLKQNSSIQRIHQVMILNPELESTVDQDCTLDSAIPKTSRDKVCKIMIGGLSSVSSQRQLYDKPQSSHDHSKSNFSKLMSGSVTHKNFFTAFTKNFREKAISPSLSGQTTFLKNTGLKLNIPKSSQTQRKDESSLNSKLQALHNDTSRRVSNQSQTNICNNHQPTSIAHHNAQHMPLSSRTSRSMSIQMQNNNSNNQQKQHSNQNCVKFQKFQARQPVKKVGINSNTLLESILIRKQKEKSQGKENESYKVICNTVDNTQESTLDDIKIPNLNASNITTVHFNFQKKLLQNQSCNLMVPVTSQNLISKNNSQILNSSSTMVNNQQDIPPVSARQSLGKTSKVYQDNKSLSTITGLSSARVNSSKYNAMIVKAKGLIIKEEDEFKKMVGQFKKKPSQCHSLMCKNK